MKRKMIITLLTAALVSSWIMATRADEFNQKSYVESVIIVLRIHADAISNLSTHKMKYSDNLVRHAVDLQRTFGLLGPMDWHAANSAKLMNKDASKSGMDEDQFEKLERRSRNAMKALVVAAQDAMVEDNSEGVNVALENVKESCNACHSYLPESVAPDVWGTLKRK
jgi:cytochrome c556